MLPARSTARSSCSATQPGTEVARTTTAADGTFFADLPGGFYVVVPQPVKGLLGTPGPQAVTVTDGAAVRLALGYDTGIR